MLESKKSFRKAALAPDGPHAKSAQLAATRLNEDKPEAIQSITLAHRAMGEEAFSALVCKTLAEEAEGGVLTRDGSRRRTPGGAFLHHCRHRIPRPMLFWVFPQLQAQPTRTKTDALPTWAGRLALLEHTKPAGEARAVATVVGKVLSISSHLPTVEFWLEVKPEATGTPKNLPRPECWQTKLCVRCTSKVWRRTGADLGQRVLAEGYPQMAPDGLTVWAERVLIFEAKPKGAKP